MALEENQNLAVDYNNITNSDCAALLPHLESFEKMLKLPVVEAAWQQSQGVYGRVKGKNFISNIKIFSNVRMCMMSKKKRTRKRFFLRFIV